jgi:hypothetical protein
MWRVMRLDDNGNTYEVARADTEEEGNAIARAFEARGHKQMYFVERVAPALSTGDRDPR